MSKSLALKIVQNYSQSLFTCAKPLSKQRIVLKQLQDFSDLHTSDRPINYIMSSPIIEKTAKIKLIDTIAKKNKFEKISIQFLYALVKNNRFNLINEITTNLEELIANSEGTKFVNLFSAFKLDKKEISEIKKRLETETGKKINLQTNIDQSLIGGIVIEYDSNFIDYSIKGALNKIKKVAAKPGI